MFRGPRPRVADEPHQGTRHLSSVTGFERRNGRGPVVRVGVEHRPLNECLGGFRDLHLAQQLTTHPADTPVFGLEHLLDAWHGLCRCPLLVPVQSETAPARRGQGREQPLRVRTGVVGVRETALNPFAELFRQRVHRLSLLATEGGIESQPERQPRQIRTPLAGHGRTGIGLRSVRLPLCK